ncbi:MAG: hypothetical protein Q9224_007264, partial [Gallowayella concinna]
MPDVKRSDTGFSATFTKRQDRVVTTPCWETDDGQVRCAANKEKRQDHVVTTMKLKMTVLRKRSVNQYFRTLMGSEFDPSL